MKKLITLGMLLLSAASYATVITVNSEPGMVADYTNLQTAIDDATAGDTIYIYPAPTTYGSINLSKQLFLLGPGHSLSYTPYVPQVGVIYFYTGSSGTIVKGIRSNGIGTVSWQTVNNVTISGCRIDAQNPLQLGVSGSILNGWIIEGCLFSVQTNGSQFGATVSQNWVVRNNIFHQWNSSGQFIRYASGHVFENNIFIQTNDANGIEATSSSDNCTFVNNIFLYTASTMNVPLSQNCTNCTFTNNISYCAFTTIPDFPDPNNLNNVNPQFVNVPLTSPSFSYSHDHHLATGSPAIGAGTNGSDIGIYDGAHDFRSQGYNNSLPRIGSVEIINGTAPPGGQIQILLNAFGAGN